MPVPLLPCEHKLDLAFSDPSRAGNGRLQLKAGVNKWQDILVLDMQQVPELEGLEGSNWWSVDLSFDEVR